MRLTSSFAVFRYDPEDKDLAKARWFGREGNVASSEAEYRGALRRHPDLSSAWLELFELLRRVGRLEDALALAREARAHFGPDAAMPLAIEGAALVDLGRLREATRALESALERDGNLALAWHETAYAAYRAGQYGRALLALDRAFTLEPHTDSLMLRGKILRATGQYDAAVVAFEAAMQSAEHDIPVRDAEGEIAATRRAATFDGRRPADFTVRERIFADSGTVVLDDTEAPGYGAEPPSADALAAGLALVPAFALEAGWRPAAIAGALATDAPLADFLAHALGAAVVPPAALDPADRPLLVTCCNDGSPEWSKHAARLARWKEGALLAFAQPTATALPADLAVTLRPMAGAAARSLLATAIAAGPTSGALPEPIRALAGNRAAPWRCRTAPVA